MKLVKNGSHLVDVTWRLIISFPHSFVKILIFYLIRYNKENFFLQCFTSSDLVSEYHRYGELHVSDRESHHSHHNGRDFADIELLAQMIVRRVINGLNMIVNCLTLNDLAINSIIQNLRRNGIFFHSKNWLRFKIKVKKFTYKEPL